MSKELKGGRNFTNQAAQHVSYFATISETNNTSKPIPQVLEHPFETLSELSCASDRSLSVTSLGGSWDSKRFPEVSRGALFPAPPPRRFPTIGRSGGRFNFFFLIIAFH